MTISSIYNIGDEFSYWNFDHSKRIHIKITAVVIRRDGIYYEYEVEGDDWEEDLDFGIEDKNNPDYWTRLEHQAAIAAMQGTLANADLLYSLCKDRGNCPVKVVAIEFANACAHALVEKYKKEE